MVEANGKSEALECNKIIVDLDKCIKCKACVSECPLRLYYFKNDNLILWKYADKTCMECGHCVAVCPTKAIKLKQLPMEDVREIPEDITKPSYDDLLTFFRIRRSVRQFKDQPVAEELWNKLIEAARTAPTGHNDQLVHLTIVRDPERLNKFNDEITKNMKLIVKLFEDPSKQDQLESIVPKRMLSLIESVLPGLKNTLKGIERGEDFWRWGGELLIMHAPKKAFSLTQDSTLAASNVMLAAEALGLATCSLGIAVTTINQLKSLARLIKLPKNHIVGYVLAVGFPKVKYYRVPARQPAKVTWL